MVFAKLSVVSWLLNVQRPVTHISITEFLWGKAFREKKHFKISLNAKVHVLKLFHAASLSKKTYVIAPW